MADDKSGPETVATVVKQLDADWERRKAKLLRSLNETPLDRWLRRRR